VSRFFYKFFWPVLGGGIVIQSPLYRKGLRSQLQSAIAPAFSLGFKNFAEFLRFPPNPRQKRGDFEFRFPNCETTRVGDVIEDVKRSDFRFNICDCVARADFEFGFSRPEKLGASGEEEKQSRISNDE
jgi:hypothetical protein